MFVSKKTNEKVFNTDFKNMYVNLHVHDWTTWRAFRRKSSLVLKANLKVQRGFDLFFFFFGYPRYVIHSWNVGINDFSGSYF